MENNSSGLRKTTVALMLARGKVDESPGMESLKYKALLPVNEKPVADYVLRALQGSMVDRVFIAQSPDARLRDVLTEHPKNIFLDVDGNEDSLAWSLAKSLEQVLDCYELEDLKNLTIMITPCDVPLVTAGDFDDLILQAQSQDYSLLLTMVPYQVVREAFPHKRFQKLFHADIQQTMSMQGVVFVSGETFRVKLPASSDVRLIVLDSEGAPIPSLERLIDRVRRGRKSIWLWPGFVFHVFIRRFVANGRVLDACQLVIDMVLRKMTVEKIHRYLFGALGITAGAVCSHNPRLSGDIDTYQDLMIISPLLQVESVLPRFIIPGA